MRKYELFCILKTGFDIENVDNTISNIEKSIENFGGKVLETNKMGRKKLAYDIDKNRDSFFVSYSIEIEADKVKELKRNLKLNENVLRNFVSTVKTKARIKQSA